ncbi:enoyl-CoA hydratase/isomerase family protein [Chloroflexota bacterium]
MAEGKVDFERRGPIGIAWIDNQAKKNALSLPVFRDLVKILDDFEQDEILRFLILTSRGDHFSTGVDIEGIDDPVAVKARVDLFNKAIFQMEKIPKPVLAAVRGYAFGGGFELALACDMIVASEKAVFSLPEAMLGAYAGFAVIRLHEVVGRLKAKELLMTCKRVSAAEAEKIGMVNKVVPDDELMNEAISIAEDVSKKGPLSIQIAKDSVNRDLDGIDFAYMKAIQVNIGGSEDLREGVKAFFERREPQFKGR